MDVLDEFIDKYNAALNSGAALHVTERHDEISPVLIDFDLRFPGGGPLEHRYTEDHLYQIAAIYLEHLLHYVDTDTATFYILEKPCASLDADGTTVKDGIHIVVPDIRTHATIQYLARERALPDLEPIFREMGATNPVEDIVDKQVIEHNNWTMLGSSKPNKPAYALTRILHWSAKGTAEDPDAQWTESAPDDQTDYVRLLSIRYNKGRRDSVIRPEVADEVRAYDLAVAAAKERKRQISLVSVVGGVNPRRQACDYLETAEKLAALLSPARADSHTDWIRVGWCLRNIDYRLLPSWIQFSRQSPKFTEGECEMVWEGMRDDGGLGIGTLHMWARQDNEAGYKKIISDNLFEKIKRAGFAGGTHFDIAEVIHMMFRHIYACACIREKNWYEFKQHRWQPCAKGYTLRKRLSDDVFREFTRAAAFYNQQATDGNLDEQCSLLEKAKAMQKIAMQLKMVNTKENFMKECMDLFFIEKFEEKLDAQTHLVGFENGVFDLEMDEFREGRPEDLVSFTTGIHYQHLDKTHPTYHEVMSFLSKILPIRAVHDYVLKALASSLDGSIRDETFHIWTGTGCHGRDAQIRLHDGSTRAIQDIVPGDCLMGDDGASPRRVLRLWRGQSPLWRVTPTAEGPEWAPFVVNGTHRLVVQLGHSHAPQVLSQGPEWLCTWTTLVDHNPYDGHIIEPRRALFPTEAAARAHLAGLDPATTLQAGARIDVTVDTLRTTGIRHLQIRRFVPATYPTRYALSAFTLTPLGEGDYFGVEVDGNHQYLDAAGIVHHNSNGKSKLLELIGKTLGDYSSLMNVTAITGKRVSSNATNSELARTKGKRLVILQEPGEDEKMNVGYMKELTGGDKVIARGLFKEPVEFKPQFKMILICNHLPQVPAEDGGTWRRIRLVEFIAKFTDKPNPDNPYEFPVDKNLSTYFDSWKEMMMAILLDYYRLYRQEGLQPPEEVLRCTREYQRSNDVMADFMEDRIENFAGAFLTFADIKNELKYWYRNTRQTAPMMKSKELLAYMEKELGPISGSSKKGWKHWRLRPTVDDGAPETGAASTGHVDIVE